MITNAMEWLRRNQDYGAGWLLVALSVLAFGLLLASGCRSDDVAEWADGVDVSIERKAGDDSAGELEELEQTPDDQAEDGQGEDSPEELEQGQEHQAPEQNAGHPK